MKESPIYFTDERWEKIASDLKEIKCLLHQLLEERIPRQEESEEVLSAKDVARLLQIDIATVYARCVKGSIPHFKIGKQYKFRQVDINLIIEKGDAGQQIDVDDYVNRYLQKNNLKA